MKNKPTKHCSRTGLFYVLGYLLLAIAPPLHAEEAENEEAAETPVIPIKVEAAEISTQPGHTKYDAEVIQNMPTGDSHLSDLLRLNPAVDFSRESDISGSATLRPDEISIHGQRFYQNLFLIDGIDTTNDLNPASTNDIFSNPSLFFPNGGSSPQGYYVDVELLDNVQVFDSNIPVEYGGFTGGVISAELKSYEGEDKFSWRFGIKRDEWERYHVNEGDLTAADYYGGVYTPDYQKTNFRVNVQREIAENWGLNLSVSRRVSRFDQRYDKIISATGPVEDRTDRRTIEYEDRVDNILGRVDTVWEGKKLGLSFRYARRRHDGLTATNYDGRFEKDHDGYGITADLEGERPSGLWKLKFGADQLSDELDSEDNLFSSHESAEASLLDLQYEGSYGDTKQRQTRLTLKPKWIFNTQHFSGAEHDITAGGEMRYTKSFYERPSKVVYEKYDCRTDSADRLGCQDYDGDGISDRGDEYLARVVDYLPGKVNLSYGEWALYAEDRMNFGRLKVNAGLRADRNSFLENLDVAPRLSLDWNVFGDGRTHITAGANRYYGRSFMRLQLNDAIYGWREWRDYNQDGSLRRLRTYDNRSGASDLDTPYSDEWMLGWSQIFGPLTLRMQYVDRKSRDGITRRYENIDDDSAREYYYTNDGRSSTESTTFEVTTETPKSPGAAWTQFTLALNYKDSESNSQDDAGYDEAIDEELIYYKGRVISFDQLPAWDYNIPFGARLFATTHIPQWNVVWSNFFNLRRGGTIAQDSRRDCDDRDPVTGEVYCDGDYDIYEDTDFKSLVIVDTKIQWQPRILDQSFYVKVEVKNVFDKVINVSTTTRRSYTSGRLWWIETGMDF